MGFRLVHILIATRTQESFDHFVLWIYIILALNNTQQYLDAPDKYQNTPLHWAMKSTNFRAGVILLDVGANVEMKNIDGQTSLHILAIQITTETDDQVRNELFHMLIYYLKKDPSSLDDVDNDGRCILHYFAEAGQYVALKIILTFGANVNIQDKLGNTPMVYAALTTSDNHKECVFQLKVNGSADHGIPNCNGDTLLEQLVNNNRDMYYFVHELIRFGGMNILVPQAPLPESLLERVCESSATEYCNDDIVEPFSYLKIVNSSELKSSN